MGLYSEEMKVMVVDDAEIDRKNLSAIIEKAGHSVVTATTGKEAIEVAKAELPKLVFLDIIMGGGMDGFKTCRTLHTMPETKEIPVIMVSAKKNKADKVWAAEQGAVGYIVKPYTEQEILDTLSKFGG
jgi:twitching motility two-component system response regulator PilH